ncbi:MAG TPA: hypothetical protein VG225_16960 [Terracidiphilus sp.]|jgi:hypothetical protein|nr:hypothetical protein [Terracidiphilus sp.]
MPLTRSRTLFFALFVLAIGGLSARAHAQAALLMEEPYGFFGTLNPTGHTAIYFARVCTETPVKLRRCRPGELGSVIARYQGIDGYDWVAMPLVPYLYSVDSISDVPERVNRETVLRLRMHYHEQHLGSLFANVFEGNIVRGGWTQLVGVAYERRIYAFRFATTEAQDDSLIARLNDHANRSDFDLIYNNCADFARIIMNSYFPRTFRRTFFPDAGMTTPRQITFKLVRYAKKHPDTGLAVFEIPQVPGYRRMSHSNKSISASLITTGYAVPIALLNPYLAGGIFVDYLVRGRYPLIPEHPAVLDPGRLSELTETAQIGQNPLSAGVQSGADSNAARQNPASPALTPGLKATLDNP